MVTFFIWDVPDNKSAMLITYKYICDPTRENPSVGSKIEFHFFLGQVNPALSHSLLGFPHTSPLNAQCVKTHQSIYKSNFTFFSVLSQVNPALSPGLLGFPRTSP